MIVPPGGPDGPLGLRFAPAPVSARVAVVELAFPVGVAASGRSSGDARHAALDLALVGRHLAPGSEVRCFAPEDHADAPPHRLPGLTRAIARAVAWAGSRGVVLVEAQLHAGAARGVCALAEPSLAAACAGAATVIVPAGNHAAEVAASPPDNVIVVGAVWPVEGAGGWAVRPASCGWGAAVRACAWGARVPVALPGEPVEEHSGTSAAAALVAGAAAWLAGRGVVDVAGELLRVARPPVDEAGRAAPDRVGVQPDLSRWT